MVLDKLLHDGTRLTSVPRELMSNVDAVSNVHGFFALRTTLRGQCLSLTYRFLSACAHQVGDTAFVSNPTARTYCASIGARNKGGVYVQSLCAVFGCPNSAAARTGLFPTLPGSLAPHLPHAPLLFWASRRNVPGLLGGLGSETYPGLAL